MNPKQILLLFSLIAATLFASAQEDTKDKDVFSRLESYEEGKGSVMIYQDFRINDLVSTHIKANKRSGGIKGYRIRIYSNSGRDARQESELTKAQFHELFPDIAVYREFQEPSYYKVYVGDFRTKNDALRVFKAIKRRYRAAFIVEDKINLPKLD